MILLSDQQFSPFPSFFGCYHYILCCSLSVCPHIAEPIRTCNVSICALGDDSLNVSVANDGSNFGYSHYQSSWEKEATLTLTNITASTALRFEVDNNGGAGGFVATITVQCDDGYSSTMITDDGNTHFDVVYSENGKYEMTNFSRFGNGTKPLVNQGNPTPKGTCDCLDECEGDCDGDGDCIGDLVCYNRDNDGTGNIPLGCSGEAHETSHDYCYDPNWLEVQCMDSDAQWMWNGLTSDHIIFEMELLPNYSPQPTANPTTAEPTTNNPTTSG